jgi:hypothetical protein
MGCVRKKKEKEGNTCTNSDRTSQATPLRRSKYGGAEHLAASGHRTTARTLLLLLQVRAELSSSILYRILLPL